MALRRGMAASNWSIWFPVSAMVRILTGRGAGAGAAVRRGGGGVADELRGVLGAPPFGGGHSGSEGAGAAGALA
ncbi:hypothetical protein GCM10010328_30390 [Streptomyces rubiginosohelvolus]|uniref:Uncharacterized protein n=1 Tax=Streptomyces rubiginosohelvolus TaxID=67362 RepID=A0ABQ3BS75_9ACTN|nr:hypothetical protein GCM10010328_30390 [Streptomyces pluricolorescens]